MPCIQTFLVPQRVIGEPPNLIHNLALKRAEIGQLMIDIAYLGTHSQPRPQGAVPVSYGAPFRQTGEFAPKAEGRSQDQADLIVREPTLG
jgi:hypothetical protein